MLEKQPDWQKYENYTVNILNDERVRDHIKNYFDLPGFEVHPKRKFKGRKTQTIWEIDGHGYDKNGQFILLECKQYSSKTVTQSTVAAFAYAIRDIGADRGIIITTLGLQIGAKRVAEAEWIGLVTLSYSSTDKNFFIRFSNAKGYGHAVGAFTDVFGSIGISSSAKIKRYPIPDRRLLEEIKTNLNRRTGRITFSDSEILEEAMRLSNKSET